VLKADEEGVVRDGKRNDSETGLNGTYYASRIWRMVLGKMSFKMRRLKKVKVKAKAVKTIERLRRSVGFRGW